MALSKLEIICLRDYLQESNEFLGCKLPQAEREFLISLVNRELKTIDKLEHYSGKLMKAPTCGCCKKFNKTYQKCISGQQIADYCEEYGVSESFECNIRFEFEEIEEEFGYLPAEDEKRATELFESRCKILPINLMDFLQNE